MVRAFFDDVADALAGFLPPAMRGFHVRTTANNVKVWFGTDHHEHYEVQLLPPAEQRAAGIMATGPALEVGFHAEHPTAATNDKLLERLRAREPTLRRSLGGSLEIGPFVGRRRGWGRASELWHGDEIDTPETAIEAAERLARYIRAIERVRTRPER